MQKTKATLADLISASNNLSPNDLSDFNAMLAGRNPVDVFPKALDETTHVIKQGNRVLAVGGHAQGGIWFVTTNVVNELSKAERFRFYRMLKSHLVTIKSESSNDIALTNFVSVNNHAHVRLLEALGATFQTGHVMSPAGFPFKQFWL
ncbi:phage protein Gp13 family protein [Pseudomonas sp. NPDC089530]|uniref:phage protein Gp13 family protein n=1 Tax=Pseudomonas sp. NPDC089530 TaxID=3390651 RepID=UPI003D0083AB